VAVRNIFAPAPVVVLAIWEPLSWEFARIVSIAVQRRHVHSTVVQLFCKVKEFYIFWRPWPKCAHGVALQVHQFTFHHNISFTDEPCNDLFNDSELRDR